WAGRRFGGCFPAAPSAYSGSRLHLPSSGGWPPDLGWRAPCWTRYRCSEHTTSEWSGRMAAKFRALDHHGLAVSDAQVVKKRTACATTERGPGLSASFHLRPVFATRRLGNPRETRAARGPVRNRHTPC